MNCKPVQVGGEGRGLGGDGQIYFILAEVFLCNPSPLTCSSRSSYTVSSQPWACQGALPGSLPLQGASGFQPPGPRGQRGGGARPSDPGAPSVQWAWFHTFVVSRLSVLVPEQEGILLVLPQPPADRSQVTLLSMHSPPRKASCSSSSKHC